MKKLTLLFICFPVIGTAQVKIPRGITAEDDKFTKSTVYKLVNVGAFSGANNCIHPEIIHTDTELFLRIKFIHHGYKLAEASKIVIALGDGVETFIPEERYATSLTRFSSGKRAVNILFGPNFEIPDSLIEIYTFNLKGNDLQRFISLFAKSNKEDNLALRFENPILTIDYPDSEFHSSLAMSGTLKSVLSMVNFYQILASGE